MMKAGISSYTYTWAIGVPGKEPENPMTVYQLLHKAAELGVDVVQIADNLPLDKFSGAELLKIKNVAEDLKVDIEVGSRMMTRENLQKYVELAVFFNSPVLRFVIDGKDYTPDVHEVIAVVSEAVPMLEENHVILAIENHDRFKASQFVEIVNAAQSECVGICLDSVNSMGAGEGLETVIEQLAPLTVNLHVKEFAVKRVYHQMGFVVEGCPLGEGMLPVPGLLKKVSARCTAAILEQWTPPDDDLLKTIEKEARWARQSIRYLKQLLS